MTQARPPTLVTNPADDLAFAAAAASAMVDARTPAELQAALRRDYPRAVVRDRDLVGDPLVWYVYREGHWVRGLDRT
jgi:uncharacterized protein YbjT (DUF2867 family)